MSSANNRPTSAAVSVNGLHKSYGEKVVLDGYVAYDAAFAWSPDDPRLDVLADRGARWLAAHRGESGEGEPPDPTISQLLSTSADSSSPAWDRLREIAAGSASRVDADA